MVRESQERPYESAPCELKAARDHDCKGLLGAFTKSEQTLLQKGTDLHCTATKVFSFLSHAENPKTREVESERPISQTPNSECWNVNVRGDWSAALKDLSGGVIISTHFYGAEELCTFKHLKAFKAPLEYSSTQRRHEKKSSGKNITLRV